MRVSKSVIALFIFAIWLSGFYAGRLSLRHMQQQTPVPSPDPVSNSYLCGPVAQYLPAMRSWWKQSIDAMPWYRRDRGLLDLKRAGRFSRALLRHERWWCLHLPWLTAPTLPPQQQQQPAQRLTLDDVVVGVFSGENVLFSRAQAVRDTWLHRFPRSYVFVEDLSNEAASDPLNVVQLRPLYGSRFRGGLGETIWWALVYMYEQNPQAKWFHLIGCDTFVAADQVLRELSNYDASQPMWVGHDYAEERMPGFLFARSSFPGKGKETFAWGSGGVGYWLSNLIVKAYTENIETFRTLYINERAFGGEPDKDQGIFLSLMGFWPQKRPMLRGMANIHGVDVAGIERHVPADAKDLTLMHGLSPARMMSLALAQEHYRVDQLQELGLQGVVAFARRFIDDHFAILKRRAVETRAMYEFCCAQAGGDKKLFNFMDFDDEAHPMDPLPVSVENPGLEDQCKAQIELLK